MPVPLLGGERPPTFFRVYWVLLSMYMFAALAGAVGDETVCTVACAAPALLAAVPIAGAALAAYPLLDVAHGVLHPLAIRRTHVGAELF